MPLLGQSVGYHCLWHTCNQHNISSIGLLEIVLGQPCLLYYFCYFPSVHSLFVLGVGLYVLPDDGLPRINFAEN